MSHFWRLTDGRVRLGRWCLSCRMCASGVTSFTLTAWLKKKTLLISCQFFEPPPHSSSSGSRSLFRDAVVKLQSRLDFFFLVYILYVKFCKLLVKEIKSMKTGP